MNNGLPKLLQPKQYLKQNRYNLRLVRIQRGAQKSKTSGFKSRSEALMTKINE